ncbi:MAG: homocysteine biosynthesis protein [Candidatus Omnitrophica bacterium]|nr:homocysteine biosynthesis protein [Candidatus Omnitrophota bacterium]
MVKTIKEINEKIKKGKAVVVTAEEMIAIVKKKGSANAAKNIDVVTTGTFAPMCSSSMYINIGHTKPRIKLGGGRVFLNDVEAYAALAAVDISIGANALPLDDPRNKVYPGEFKYGGGHVIEDFVKGSDIKLEGSAYGTDCYPRKDLTTKINIKDVNEAVLFNPRNCYQNYNVAVNLSNKIIYTYMGLLKPKLGNANYCSAGALSPLLKDPYYRTIGIGSRIFLGGGIGYVCFWGTQHNPSVERTKKGIPKSPAVTIAVIGDLKQMNANWIKGASMLGYGASLSVGIGIPIPILDKESAYYAAIEDKDIWTNVIDYGKSYPKCEKSIIAKVNYAQLRSGKIKIKGKYVPTASLSSYSKAKEISQILKSWIEKGSFILSEPVHNLPGDKSGYRFKSLEIRN